MLSPRGETCVCFLLEERLFIPVALAKLSFIIFLTSLFFSWLRNILVV